MAINDKVGILDIPALAQKCNNEECVSVFRNFKNYRSGELVKAREQNKDEMGNTLYIGSMKSEVYFCAYEKDYEQYIKRGIPLENAEVKNRFEIRLKSERAEMAVKDLLSHRDAELTAFSIINRYVRFVDKEENKPRCDWLMNERWAWFIGENRPKLKLTTQPEPYTLERTLRWINRQVAPTLKMVRDLDSAFGTTVLADMVEQAKLSDKHDKIIAQQVTDIEELLV